MTDPWRFQQWAFHTKTGNPARKAVLSMLAMMADMNTGRCEAKQETLAEGCELSERSIRAHLKGLADDGLIARRPQWRRDRGRRGDEFLLLAPDVTEWPDGEQVHPAPLAAPPGEIGNPPRGIQPSGQEQPPLDLNDHSEERARECATPHTSGAEKKADRAGFSEWLAYHREITSSSLPNPGTETRRKLAEAYLKCHAELQANDVEPIEGLKRATRNAFADEFRVEKGYIGPANVLKVVNVLGLAQRQPPSAQQRRPEQEHRPAAGSGYWSETDAREARMAEIRAERAKHVV